jgi:hypothetical protein
MESLKRRKLNTKIIISVGTPELNITQGETLNEEH